MSEQEYKTMPSTEWDDLQRVSREGFVPKLTENWNKGVKHDSGKVKAGMLKDFANAITEVLRVGTYGVKKYDRANWLKVDNAVERYEDAAMRHRLAHWSGEVNDIESNLSHEAHALWNDLAVLELKIRASRDAGI